MAGAARKIVVVGAGSSGGAAAARLAEQPDKEVVLLEAGPHYRTDAELPEHLRNPEVAQRKGHDWGFQAFCIEPSESREPIDYPRGMLVGGSSAVNGAGAQRGNVEDFDEWAALGNPDWAFERVLPAFCRLENDLQFGEQEHHGSDGPVPILRQPDDEWPPATRAFFEEVLARGYPYCADLNLPHGHGVGPIPRNFVDGMRGSTARTYLRGAEDRPNFTIRGSAPVAGLLFDQGRIAGVEIDYQGQREQVEADSVVLCAGAIKTPQLLMLSGLGPAASLERLGVEVRADIPGVGRNLIDHPMAPIIGLVKEAGPGDFNGFRTMLKFSSEGSPVPDLYMLPGMSETSFFNFDTGIDAPGAFGLWSLLGKPRSVGWLELTDADPFSAPGVHLNFLSDPEGADIARLAECVRHAYDLMTASPVADLLSEILFIDAETVSDDDCLAAWLRASVNTGFHSVGTCRMGPAEDAEAVVDQRLRLRGAEGVYVADASVMPRITSGVTNLPCFMIGERVAEFIAAEP